MDVWICQESLQVGTDGHLTIKEVGLICVRDLQLLYCGDNSRGLRIALPDIHLDDQVQVPITNSCRVFSAVQID